MLRSYTLTLFISLLLLLGLTGCDTPSFGKKVEKKYYTGGQIMSEFEWTDSTGQNGIRRTFGFEGHQTSSVHITNGVPNGIMSIYDAKGRVIKQTPYINGKIHGIEKAFYPNGDRMITFTSKMAKRMVMPILIIRMAECAEKQNTKTTDLSTKKVCLCFPVMNIALILG